MEVSKPWRSYPGPLPAPSLPRPHPPPRGQEKGRERLLTNEKAGKSAPAAILYDSLFVKSVYSEIGRGPCQRICLPNPKRPQSLQVLISLKALDTFII